MNEDAQAHQETVFLMSEAAKLHFPGRRKCWQIDESTVI